MDIWFLTSFPDPGWTSAPRGGYRRNLEMMRLLARCYRVNLVVSARCPFEVEVPDSVQATVVAQQWMPLRWLKLLWTLLRHVPRTTPVLCYNPSLHMVPALWLRWLGRPVVVDYVDKQGTEVESHNWLLRKLGSLVEALFLRSCDQYITSSSALAEVARARKPQARVHMFRGTFHLPANGQPQWLWPGGMGDPIRVMYLGMMRDESGVRELVRAFAGLDSGDVHLFMVGHGPAREECVATAERLAPGRVSFPDLGDEVLHRFMKGMDVLTVPYLDVPRNRLNFPSKIIEYLWAGKAILATRVGEISRALKDGETALLVPPTEAGLLGGLRQLVRDPGLRRRLGTNARAEFERRYSPESAADELVRFVACATPRKPKRAPAHRI